MEKISICLAGAGRSGEVHGDVYYLSVPNSQIVAVIAADESVTKGISVEL